MTSTEQESFADNTFMPHLPRSGKSQRPGIKHSFYRTISPYKCHLRAFLWVLAVIFLGFNHPLFSQETGRYYRVDQVVTIRGTITEIKNEPCFARDEFVVIYVKEEKNSTIYRVEVSPQWFFKLNVEPGNQIEVTGSTFKIKETQTMLTRSLHFLGQTYWFRDEYGFPLWRGKGKGMNRKNQGMGGNRRRGQS